MNFKNHRLVVLCGCSSRCFGRQGLYFGFYRLNAFLQVLQFGVQAFFALTIDLTGDLLGQLAKQFAHVFHPSFNFAVQLGLAFFHAIKFFRGVSQTMGGVAKSSQGGVKFNHALANGQRENIQLANVLLQSGGNGKKSTHRNHQKTEQTDQHDTRMQHIATAHFVYFDHHIAHFLADVGRYLS